MDRVVGQTKDVGFEIGVSRTVDHPPEAVWAFLTGPDGLVLWLGQGVALATEKGQPYRTLDGTEGEIRSFRPVDRVRLTWRPPGWDHDTTVQVAVVGPERDARRCASTRSGSLMPPSASASAVIGPPPWIVSRKALHEQSDAALR